MKSIYIFTQFPDSYAPPRLKEESEKLGFDASIFSYNSVSLLVNDNNLSAKINNQIVEAPNYTILRSSGKGGHRQAVQQGIYKWLKANNVRVLNDETILKHQSFDKVMQHIEFSIGNIPHIKSDIFMDLVAMSESITDYPVVLKSFTGSHGDKVKKITKQSDVFHFSKNEVPVLVQPFLKAGKDVRVVVLGYKALGAMVRTAKSGAFLTNYSAGGEVENFDLEKYPEVREISEKTAKHFRCEYAGVDLMQDDEGNWKVLEVNRFCQFEGFEKATGINFAGKVIEYITL